MQQITKPAVSSVGVVSPDIPPPPGVRRLTVLLVKPSKYDDEGYVIRYLRGVLPSNTLATLRALTEEAASRGDLGPVDVRTVMLDETVQRIRVRRLVQRHRRRHTKVVVALCGVQTNQFPRAADLARRFHQEGVPVMIGGFHVSGAIAMSLSGIPSECRELIDEGITLVKGEVEECWGDLLRDALHDRLRTYYDVTDRPDLSQASIPVVDPKLMKRFAYPYMGTIDAGRGCPFHCRFCSIINVQGHTMRFRKAEKIIERIRENRKLKIDYYFFTDDNFARNPEWERIFDELIELRRREGIRVEFMMQVDTRAHKLKNFVRKAAEAGCSQVFIGMETLNPDNLPAAGKPQNRVNDYRSMVEIWHAEGIACHVGYIIGFPCDTPETVHEEIRRLRDEVGVDQASFFILTPIPGSADHRDMAAAGKAMDPDYNRYDSFRPVTDHPRMTRREWYEVYQEAWREFYSVPGMIGILSRAPAKDYWGLFKNFLWYRYAVLVENTHPMICGFLRRKGRTERRPGFVVESRLRHLRRRFRELRGTARGVAALFFDMQEVWLATRGRPAWESAMEEWRARYDGVRGRVGDSAHRAGEVFRERADRVRSGAGEALARAGELKRQAAEELAHRVGALRGHARKMSFLHRQAVRIRHPFAVRARSRRDLNAYWRATWNKLRRGRIYAVNPFRLGWCVARDLKLAVAFSRRVYMGR